jgi:hypothetical protein
LRNFGNRQISRTSPIKNERIPPEWDKLVRVQLQRKAFEKA